MPHFFWLAATAFALSRITTPVTAAELKVLSIGDGDTIRVSSPSGTGKTTVRLACIDAPETSQAPYGNAARQALQEQLPIGTEVGLRTKATDRYGRTVAEVLKGAININQVLVQSGAAFVYWQYIEGCDRETYSRLENEARLKSLGVWAIPGGIQRPWDYRRGSKSGSNSNNPTSVTAVFISKVGRLTGSKDVIFFLTVTVVKVLLTNWARPCASSCRMMFLRLHLELALQGSAA